MDAQMQQVQTQPTLLPPKVGIIGDIHAQNAALDAALSFLRGLPGVSTILCSGDLVTGQGDANAVITLLREAGVLTVRGNHDRWFGHDYYLALSHATPTEAICEENRFFIYGLPPTQTFNTPSGSLLLCHGVGDDDMAGIYPGDENSEVSWVLQEKELSGFRYIVAGHTHARMVRPIAHPNGNVTTVINAGTLLPDKKPGFLVCDFAAQTAAVYYLSPDSVTEGRTVSLNPDNPEGN